jgi:hypothetical protein
MISKGAFKLGIANNKAGAFVLVATTNAYQPAITPSPTELNQICLGEFPTEELAVKAGEDFANKVMSWGPPVSLRDIRTDAGSKLLDAVSKSMGFDWREYKAVGKIIVDGVTSRKYGVQVETVETFDGAYMVQTVDQDGNVIEEQHFSNFEEASRFHQTKL